jgi:hypothetical protein
MEEMERKHKEEMQQLRAELQAASATKDEDFALMQNYRKEVEELKRMNMELERRREEDLKFHKEEIAQMQAILGEEDPSMKLQREKIAQLQAKLDSGECVIC